jgi:hypothetical protein
MISFLDKPLDAGNGDVAISASVAVPEGVSLHCFFSLIVWFNSLMISLSFSASSVVR